LAITTIAASTAMSATVGDNVSVTATMTAVSLPEMRKYKYDDRLSAGCIAAGGTLGPIIPPSVVFIVYGLLTQVSIGSLLVGGILPGVILAFSFAVAIFIWCRINPNIGPPGERSSWGQRIKSLSATGPVLVLFLLVIGGMYFGIFTPNEAGGIGAIGTLILMLAYRRCSWKQFTQSLLDTVKVSSMVFLMVIGAQLFTRFCAWCDLGTSITNALNALGLSPFWDVIIIEAAFFILGFCVDPLPLLMMGVPIVHPIIVALGIDPIWFAVTTCIVINIGVISPPEGIVLFTIKAMAGDIPIGTIFRGVMPFVYASGVSVILLFAFPAIVTWLPHLMYK